MSQRAAERSTCSTCLSLSFFHLLVSFFSLSSFFLSVILPIVFSFKRVVIRCVFKDATLGTRLFSLPFYFLVPFIFLGDSRSILSYVLAIAERAIDPFPSLFFSFLLLSRNNVCRVFCVF